MQASGIDCTLPAKRFEIHYALFTKIYQIMKTYLMLCIGAFFFLFACQEDTIAPDKTAKADQSENQLYSYTAPADVMESLPAESAHENGMDVTRHLVFHPTTGIFYVTESDDCADFGVSHQTIVEGGGIATHIGQYSVLNYVCISDPADPVSFAGPFLGIITSANGDEIHTMVIGMEPDMKNPPNATIHYLVMGGTGRFIGATGFVDMYGFLDFTEGTWSLSGTGEITY